MCVTNTISRRKALSLAGIKTADSVSKELEVNQHNDCRIVSSGLPLNSSNVFAYSEYQFGSGIFSPGSNALLPSVVDPVAAVSSHRNPDALKPPRRRRRLPQKPGRTAKQNERHFVVHNYHDHAADLNHLSAAASNALVKRRGGLAVTFPIKLHELLDQIEADGLAHVISWQAHGRAFLVHDPAEFVSHVLPKYFKQTKITSFQRQLNLYGFCRLTAGPDARAYYHELFLRGMPFLCSKMTRVKIKGTGFKAASSPENEPDFYSMRPVLVTPPDSGASDHDSTTDSDSDSAYSQQHPMSPIGMTFPMVAPILMASMTSPVQSFDSSPSFEMTPAVFSREKEISTLPQSDFSFDIEDSSVLDSSDRTLDEVIEELFVNDETELAEVDDFVQTWGISKEHSFMDAFETLDSDDQLGTLLQILMA